MNPLFTVIVLLIISNLFMTMAWYGHLKFLGNSPLIIAILVSWGIALFEYMVQVPANRIGAANGLDVPHLKIMQEVITLAVFAPFYILVFHKNLGWNYVGACACMIGAVLFIFMGK